VPQMLAALERKTIDTIVVVTPEKLRELKDEYQPNDKLLWVLITSKTK